jgi:hypothetical protein
MQNGLFAIVQGSLLDALQTQHLGVEIVVFLSIADTQCQVMMSPDVVVYAHL